MIAGNESRTTSGGAVHSVAGDCVGTLRSNATRIGVANPLCQVSGAVTYGTPDRGPLGNHCGLTQTHAVAADDAGLIDSGDACIAGYSPPLATDQQGAARSSAGCFLGAYEPTGVSLDVEASAPQFTYDGLSDGVILLRYLFGLSGPILTAGLDSIPGTRTPTQIKQYLDANRALLDIDGDGNATALTDGLLIARYLSGLRGEALVAGALGNESTRSDPAAVEAAIKALMP